MAPITPYWTQPSHPSIQKVLLSNAEDFTTKSVSTIDVAPFGLYAKLKFPPCTRAEKPIYATVQMGKSEHLNLNSDLVYINHSCEPSVIFDMSSLSIMAGSKGLRANEELTFFYPSTEWDMAQGFDCFCGSKTCKGWIDGAKNMSKEKLDGMWLNAHVRELLEERDNGVVASGNGEAALTTNEKDGSAPRPLAGSGADGAVFRDGTEPKDATEEALKASLEQARRMVDAAKKALDTYNSIHIGNGKARTNGVGSRELSGEMGGDTRHGITSRELSGEMGGDTEVDI